MARNKLETIQKRKDDGYYSELGKKGFEATTVKYFDGDRTAAGIWLRTQGKLIERRRPWETYWRNMVDETEKEESRHNNTQ